MAIDENLPSGVSETIGDVENLRDPNGLRVFFVNVYLQNTSIKKVSE
jgi:hypothetical protein